jgi:hypothetical protein
MLYREIIAVCSQIHTKHINTLCGRNVELLNVKLAVHIVTTSMYEVKAACFWHILVLSKLQEVTIQQTAIIISVFVSLFYFLYLFPFFSFLRLQLSLHFFFYKSLFMSFPLIPFILAGYYLVSLFYFLFKFSPLLSFLFSLYFYLSVPVSPKQYFRKLFPVLSMKERRESLEDPQSSCI